MDGKNGDRNQKVRQNDDGERAQSEKSEQDNCQYDKGIAYFVILPLEVFELQGEHGQIADQQEAEYQHQH